MGLGSSFDDVLAAARTGAEWALTALYRDLHQRLVAYLRAHEPNEAEDLAAEVWQSVGEGLTRFEGGEAAFRAWLFTIARRRLADWRRQQGRRRTDVVAAERLDQLTGPDDPEGTALAGVSGDEAVRRIRDALSPDQAEIVLLRVVGGLDADEVGRLLGKRPGTVRVLQHRALRKLAETFSAEDVTP